MYLCIWWVFNAEFSPFQKLWTFPQWHSLRSRGKRWMHRWASVKLLFMSSWQYVNKLDRLLCLRCWCWSWRPGCRKRGSDLVNWGRSITSLLASQRAGEGRTRVRPTITPQTQYHLTISQNSLNIPELPSEWGRWRFLGQVRSSIKVIGGAKGVVCLLVHNSLFLLCLSAGTGWDLSRSVQRPYRRLYIHTIFPFSIFIVLFNSLISFIVNLSQIKGAFF